MFAMIAAIAQEESCSKSENIKWGMRHQASQGKAILNHTCFLGYTKDKAGQLIIVPDEAEVVRLIFFLYLSGMRYRQIKRHLEQNDIKTASGKDAWSTSTIDRILSNEKYMGILITRKAYVADFLEGRQVKNNGEVTQHVFENNHEAIIDLAVFEQTEKVKLERSSRKGIC